MGVVDIPDSPPSTQDASHLLQTVSVLTTDAAPVTSLCRIVDEFLKNSLCYTITSNGILFHYSWSVYNHTHKEILILFNRITAMYLFHK